MKLLVTGGCGFIGSNFIRYWLTQHPDDTVVNLDVLTYAGNPANLAEFASDQRYQLIKGSITDRQAVSQAMQGVDTVVHFAAESHVDNSITNPLAFVETNVMGTAVLLDVARQLGIKRFQERNLLKENLLMNKETRFFADQSISRHPMQWPPFPKRLLVLMVCVSIVRVSSAP
jgi:dTDP-D-glucose 4,6-dehydratase